MKLTLDARLNTDLLSLHSLIQGASGSGKTTQLISMALSVIKATNTKKNIASCVIIEPHSDLVSKIMSARAVDDDRLVYVSTMIQSESGVKGITPCVNFFQLPPDADEMYKHTLASQLASAIAETVETGQYGITINMHMILLPAILVTLSSPNPSMATLKRMLTDGMNEDLLEIGRSYPHEQIQDFFLNHWGSKDYDMTKRALISKANYILNSITMYNLVNDNGIDFEKCLNEGKVIVINAPVGGDPFASTIIGKLTLATLFSTLLRRVNTDAKRVPCYIFIDEMDSYASSTLGDMLRQSRKFGARLILSGQSLKGLSPALRGACLTNTFLKLVSITDSETRSLMAKEMKLSVDELSKIEPMQFMVSRNDGGKTKPFRIRAVRLPKEAFLTKSEIHERLLRQIQHTGVYKTLPPPPPPAPPLQKTEKVDKTKSKQKTEKKDSDGFDVQPAF